MSNSGRTDVRVTQIISTEKRRAILDAILAQNGYFTITDIYEALKAKKVSLRVTSVLNVIKSLHYAGLLSEEPEKKKTKSVGRSKNLYKIVE